MLYIRAPLSVNLKAEKGRVFNDQEFLRAGRHHDSEASRCGASPSSRDEKKCWLSIDEGCAKAKRTRTAPDQIG